MFRSATLKLTRWYLVILMSISLLFSIGIYQLNYNEVNVRLENLQEGLIGTRIQTEIIGENRYPEQDELRLEQSRLAATQMILALVYINTFILIAGGFGSYFLARRTLEPIEKAHEAQSRFTSDASHELRTPLAAMKAELEVYFRDQNPTLEEAKELLNSNLEEVNKLITLSEMLLKMAHLDYTKLEKQQIDIVGLVPAAMKPFVAHKKRFRFTMQKQAMVYANEAAIIELMSILIENAIKYSPERSRITVRVFERRMMIAFEIKNTGQHINPERLPFIFDRFYRGDHSRTASTKTGFGLGLAIAKKITEIHYGYIQASSTEKETRFTFYIPSTRNIGAKIQHPGL